MFLQSFYRIGTYCRYIEHELNHSSWKGEALCHFRWIMSGTLENSFSFLLVLLSIERMILLLMPRIHAKSLTRLVLFCVIAGSWVLSLILATIQMYASTGGIVYHAESGWRLSRCYNCSAANPEICPKGRPSFFNG